MTHQWLPQLKRARGTVRDPRRRRVRPPDLQLELLERRAVPAGTTLTWTGAGPNDHWSNQHNWTHSGGNDKVPKDGDTLVFPAINTKLTSMCDIPNLTLASIAFNGTEYVISGQGFTLTGGIQGNVGAGQDSIDVPVSLTGNTQSFNIAGGLTLALGDGITPATGTPSLTLDGDGTVVLGGTSAIRGSLDVRKGTLQIDGVLRGGASFTSGELFVEHGATLIVNGSVGPLSIVDHGTITVEAAANGQSGGNIVMQGDERLEVAGDGTLTDAGNITVGAVATKGGGNLVVDDGGSVLVSPSGVLQDEGSLTVHGHGTLTDAGSVSVGESAKSASLDVQDGANLDVKSTGTLTVDKTLTVESGGTLTNDGSVTIGPGAKGPAGEIDVQTGGTLVDNGTMTAKPSTHLNNAGSLTVKGGHTLDVSGTANLFGAAAAPSTLKATLTNNPTPVISLGSDGPGVLKLDTAGAGTSKLDLSAASDFAPRPGQQITLVANASGSPVHGVFDDPNGKPLEEGDTVQVDSFNFTISYKGGTSHQDVVLTRLLPSTFTIGIESHLSVPLMVNGQSVPASGSISMELASGTYALEDPRAAGASVQFRVTSTGTVENVSAPDGVLSGFGTQNLVVQGDTVTIDTQALSPTSLTLDGTLTLPTNAQAPFSFTDLPGTYTLTDSFGGFSVPGLSAVTGSSVQFGIDSGGNVTYASDLEGALQGAGTKALTVNGVAVQIDARRVVANLLDPVMAVTGVNGTFPASHPQAFMLLPGTYYVQVFTSFGSPGDAPLVWSFNLSARDELTFADQPFHHADSVRNTLILSF